MELSRYIVFDPLRAGMLDDVSLYNWSSFRAMAGLEISPDWLSVTWILGRFGDDFNASQLKFIEFVHQGLQRPSPWLELKGQILLVGSDQFVSQLKHRLNTMIP